MNDKWVNQGHPIYFGDGWYYTATDPSKWHGAPKDAFWWETELTVHAEPVPGSHAISAEMLTSIFALAQSGRQGVPIGDCIITAWGFAHELRLEAFSAGGIPRVRLDEHHLSIAFAEPDRHPAMVAPPTIPAKRKRRRLDA